MLFLLFLQYSCCSNNSTNRTSETGVRRIQLHAPTPRPSCHHQPEKLRPTIDWTTQQRRHRCMHLYFIPQCAGFSLNETPRNLESVFPVGERSKKILFSKLSTKVAVVKLCLIASNCVRKYKNILMCVALQLLSCRVCACPPEVSRNRPLHQPKTGTTLVLRVNSMQTSLFRLTHPTWKVCLP